VLTGTLTSNVNHSAAFQRGSDVNVILKNNLLYNQRSATGTANNYALQNNATTAGWPAGSTDYNLLYATDTAKCTYSAPSGALSLNGWRAATTCDINSVSATVPFLSPSDLHIDVTSPDAWNVYGRGITLPTVAIDIDGNQRSTSVGIPTTIGSDEIAMPVVLPQDMIMIPATPVAGVPAVFMSAGRKIAEINWLGAVPAALSAKYYPGVQAPNPTTSPNIYSYLDVTATPDNGSPYTIKTYYTHAEDNGIADAMITGIKKHGTAPYIATSVVGNVATDINGKFVTSATLYDFSIFTLTGQNVPLSVTLEKISAENVGQSNKISWTSAREANGDLFELESSTDAKHFGRMAAIPAMGRATTYTYWDDKAVVGINYYRIKFIDRLNHAIYSEVVSAVVQPLDKFELTAYPNPTQDKLSLHVEGVIQPNAIVQLTDVSGKLLKSIRLINNNMEIDMKGFAPGIYLFKYVDEHQSQTLKVRKQ
jgi:hypothetical protein